MESPGNDRRDFARAIYEMHVRQWRSVETSRMTFALAYILATIGTLAWHGEGVFALVNWPVALFLMALAKIGYLLSIHQESEIESHRHAARFILERYSLLHYWNEVPVPLLIRLIPIGRLYSVFYLFSFSFFLMALLNIITGNFPLSLSVAAVVYGIGFLITMVYRRRTPKAVAGSHTKF